MKKAKKISQPEEEVVAGRDVLPDPVYHSKLVSKLINYVMRKGKKQLAQKIVWRAFEIIKEKENKNPLEIFYQAVAQASPQYEIRVMRVGGASYQVPKECPIARQRMYAMKWMVEGARKIKGKPMFEKLAQEILETAKGKGFAVKKKEEVEKIALANQAFAYLLKSS